jgi:hypothetical protein
MTPELDRDEHGEIVTRPVTGWETHSVYGTAILLATEYVENEQELESGVRHRIQLVLTRQGALDVAEALKRAGSRVREPVSGIPVH